MNKTIIITILFSIGLSWLAFPTSAQNAKFYALFMAKFTDYIQWSNSNDQIVIGVYGSPDIISELRKFSASKGNIKVIKLSSVNDVQKCQLVFLANSKKSEFESINASIDSKQILLVTENDLFVNKGADISFFFDGTKLRFKINKNTLDSKKLKVSGSLLALAEVV